MKAKIDHEECTGDGICEEICPEVFELGSDGISHVINDNPGAELSDKVKEAINECPAGAISVEE